MRHLFLVLPFVFVACSGGKFDDDDDDDDAWGRPHHDSGDIGAFNQDGSDVFASNCAVCHGADGSGTPSSDNADLNERVPSLSNADLRNVIENGKSGTGMPNLGLNSGAVNAVFDYLRDEFGDEGGTFDPATPNKYGSIRIESSGFQVRNSLDRIHGSVGGDHASRISVRSAMNRR